MRWRESAPPPHRDRVLIVGDEEQDRGLVRGAVVSAPRIHLTRGALSEETYTTRPRGRRTFLMSFKTERKRPPSEQPTPGGTAFRWDWTERRRWSFSDPVAASGAPRVGISGGRHSLQEHSVGVMPSVSISARRGSRVEPVVAALSAPCRGHGTASCPARDLEKSGLLLELDLSSSILRRGNQAGTCQKRSVQSVMVSFSTRIHAKTSCKRDLVLEHADYRGDTRSREHGIGVPLTPEHVPTRRRSASVSLLNPPRVR